MFIDGFRQDLRHAGRALRARPALTAVAVLSLALGIGVNTTIFSFYDHLLLRPLAVPDPSAIVNVTAPGPRPGSSSTGDSGGSESVFSYPLVRDLERLAPAGLAGIAAHTDFTAHAAFRGQTTEVDGLLVSGGYFPTLGLVPALGRLLTPADDRPGSELVAVISHRYWAESLGADPSVIGQAMIVNGAPVTIVGVGPEGFSGTTVTDVTAIFTPLASVTAMTGRPNVDARDDHYLYVFGRLRTGDSPDQAQRALNAPFTALIRDVDLPALYNKTPEADREALASRQIVLEDGSRGRNRNRAQAQLILVLLLAVTGFVLLIACANVANLLLARVTDREAEIAVRVALGASRVRIAGLLLAEAAILGALGAVGALGIARVALTGMLTLFPPDNVVFLRFGLNWSVMLFALAVGIGTALAFGLFPALHAASGHGPQTGTTRSSSSRRANRFRTSLATAQIALATALLAQAGVLVLNLTNVASADLGLRREGLVTFRVSPGQSGYTRERSFAIFDRLDEDLRALPGVTAVTASTVPILSGTEWANHVTVAGVDPTSHPTRAYTAHVGPGYFSTLGIPLAAGREFSPADAGERANVAIVNEAFVHQFALGDDVIGRRMRRGRDASQPFDLEIVGVVRDARYSELAGPVPAQFYQPYRQMPPTRLTYYVRTAGDTRALLAAIPSVVKRVDANLPVTSLLTLEAQVWDQSTPERLLATLSSSLSVLAAILAAVGLYAVLAYTVARRQREFGIRVALGARPAAITWLVAAHVARMAIVGAGIGGLIALALARLGASLLSGVSGVQPGILAAAVVVITVVIVVAGTIPARRAAAVEAATALRAE